MDEPNLIDGTYGQTPEAVARTLRFALEIVSDGIWDWNIRTNHVKRSPGWYSMLGYAVDSLPESVATWHETIHPEDFERVMRGFQAYLDGVQPVYAEEYRCRCRDGGYLWVSDHGRFVEFDEEGTPTRMIGAHRNIHEAKLAELALQRKNRELAELNRRLEELVAIRTEALRRANQALVEQAVRALHLRELDPLTRLANRRGFEKRLQTEWHRLHQHGHACALLMFDLDRFKRVNDCFGLPGGDRVLVAVAEAVRRDLRELDCLARWSGEAFIVLVPETDTAAAYRLAERLRQSLRRIDTGLPVPLTASFAVGAMRLGEEPSVLIRRLGEALYQAKWQRDCIVVCS